VTNDLSAGTRVKALDFPRAQSVKDQTTLANLTNTTYATGTPEVAVRFMAPSSGRVLVVVSAGTRNNTTANEDRIFIGWHIYTGDPADADIYQTEEVKLGLSNPSAGADDYSYGGHGTMVQGLTPGEYYYCRVRYRTTLGSGTADIAYRAILVTPIP
jgi:hypothetical protein